MIFHNDRLRIISNHTKSPRNLWIIKRFAYGLHLMLIQINISVELLEVTFVDRWIVRVNITTLQESDGRVRTNAIRSRWHTSIFWLKDNHMSCGEFAFAITTSGRLHDTIK